MRGSKNQFSVQELLIAITVFCVFFSILGSAIEEACEVARIRGTLPEVRPGPDWLTMTVAQREQHIEQRARREDACRFRGHIAVAVNGAFAILVITWLLVGPAHAGRPFHPSLCASLVSVCALLMLLSVVTSWAEFCWEYRKTNVPGLSSNQPYWATEEGQRIVRHLRMSRAELIWIERIPQAFRFRLACVIAAIYSLLLTSLMVRHIVRSRCVRLRPRLAAIAR